VVRRELIRGRVVRGWVGGEDLPEVEEFEEYDDGGGPGLTARPRPESYWRGHSRASRGPELDEPEE